MKGPLILFGILALLISISTSAHAQLSSIELIDNTDQCLTDCSATVQLTYHGSLEKALTELMQTEFFAIGKDSSLSYEILEVKEQDKSVPEYEKVCTNKGKVIVNGTERDGTTCADVLKGYKSERQSVLENLRGDRSLKPGDTAVIKIIAAKQPGDSIKWGLHFDGAYLDPWWNSTWDYREPFWVTESANNYYDNITILQSNLNVSKLYAEGKINANCSDLRIADMNDKELGFCIGSPFCWNGAYSCNTTMGAPNPRIYIMGNLTALENATWYAYYGNPAAVTTTAAVKNAFFNFQNDTTYEPAKWLALNTTYGPFAGLGFKVNSTTPGIGFIKTAVPLNLSGNLNGWCMDYRINITGGAGITHVGAVINNSAYAGGNYVSFADGTVKLYSKWDIDGKDIYYFYFNTTGGENLFDSYADSISNGTQYIEEICKNSTHYFYNLYNSTYGLLKAATPVAKTSVRGGAADTILLGDPLAEAWAGFSMFANQTIRGWSSAVSPSVSVMGSEETSPFYGNFSLTYPSTVEYGALWNVTWDTTALKNVTKFMFKYNATHDYDFTFTKTSSVGMSHSAQIDTLNGVNGSGYIYSGTALPGPHSYPFNVTTAQGWFNATHTCFDFDNCTYEVSITGQTLNVTYPLSIAANLSASEACFGGSITLNGYLLDTAPAYSAMGYNWTIETYRPDGTRLYDYWPATLVEVLPGTYSYNVTKSNATSHTWPLLTFGPNEPALNQPGQYAFTLTVCDVLACNTTSAGTIDVSYDACGAAGSFAQSVADLFGVPVEMGLFIVALIISMLCGIFTAVVTKSGQFGIVVLLASFMGFGIISWVPAWLLVLLGVFGGLVLVKVVAFQ